MTTNTTTQKTTTAKKITVRRWLGANPKAAPGSAPYWQVIEGRSRVIGTYGRQEQAEQRAADLRAQRIADAFVAVLRDWLTADEWAAMAAANRDETHPGICHSHDFCDANMAMAEAFEQQGLTVDVNDDAQVALWNAAWNLAMPTLGGRSK